MKPVPIPLERQKPSLPDQAHPWIETPPPQPSLRATETFCPASVWIASRAKVPWPSSSWMLTGARDKLPPALVSKGKRVTCTDEKTGVQALARAQPTKPLRPGSLERFELEGVMGP